MATHEASDLRTRSKHMGQYGELNGPKFKVTPAAAAAADVFRMGIIPAGTEVSAIILANGDLDSNGVPTAAFKMGYTPVNAADGPAASDAYFQAAGDTAFQSANAGKVYSNFDAIKFEYDVFLDITLTAGAATFAAGSVYATVLGRNVGVK